MAINKKGNKPTIGIISPVGEVPPEVTFLYGKDVHFVAANAAVKSLTPEGYENAVKNIPHAVDQLVQAGADAISIMGTSLTFYRGRSFNEQLQKSVADQTGLPCTTMTSAVIEGLHVLKAKNIAVATAYSKEVTQLLVNVLKEYDLNPISVESLDTDIAEVRSVSTEDIVQLGIKSAQNKQADALLISCGGLRTLKATEMLEDKLRIPVVSSAVAGAWASVRLVGHSGFAVDGGRLLLPH